MISSLTVLHSLEHSDRFTKFREERGREEIEVIWGRKKRVKRRESNQASNHTPKQKWVLKIRFLKAQN